MRGAPAYSVCWIETEQKADNQYQACVSIGTNLEDNLARAEARSVGTTRRQ
jgi:hypothetical protein